MVDNYMVPNGLVSCRGTMIARAFARCGYHILATNEYPSLIRGGHNIVSVRISPNYFESMNRDLHILIALNSQSVELHKAELSYKAMVVYDPKAKDWASSEFPKSVLLIPVPLSELVSAQNGTPVMRNTVALGVTMALLGADFEMLATVIRDQFKKKSQGVIDGNVAIAKSGYEYIQNKFRKNRLCTCLLPKKKNHN